MMHLWYHSPSWVIEVIIYSRACYEQPLLWAANLLWEATRSFLKMILINELVWEICHHLPGNHMHCTDGCTDVHNFFSSYKEIDINTKPIQFFSCTYSNNFFLWQCYSTYMYIIIREWPFYFLGELWRAKFIFTHTIWNQICFSSI